MWRFGVFVARACGAAAETGAVASRPCLASLASFRFGGGSCDGSPFSVLPRARDPASLLPAFFRHVGGVCVTVKDSIEALLKNNTLLTKTNTELPAVIKSQAAEIKSLYNTT